MPAGLYDVRFLNSARLQAIVETAASELERTRPLLYLDRLGMVNATDDELFGRFTARAFAADIIADDQKAVVYEGGQVTVLTHQLPNVKIGRKFNQFEINMLNKLQNGGALTAGANEQYDWEVRFGANLVQGVRERLNAMACGMMIDSYSYDRWGVKLSAATWGMPANLKVTVSPAWSLDAGVTANAANAKPIRDILALDKTDADNYGLGAFNRVTMSTGAFDILVQTTDFLNRASLFQGAGFALTAGQLLTENRDAMVTLAGRILQKEIILDDKTFREQKNDGTQQTTRVLPVNKVLLDRTGNGANEWDMGNGVVTESVVADLIGGTVLGENPAMLPGGAYGPLGYYTPASPDLNPPGIIGWGVARAFPRKFVLESSAVLTVW